MNRSQLADLVLRKVSELVAAGTAEVRPDSKLVGQGAVIGSMGLVNLIVDLEGELLDLGYEIELASQEAMSSRKSPFRTIEALTDHILELIAE